MKRLSLILLFTAFAKVACAQVFYQPFSVGAGYGITVAYAGEQTLTSANAADINFNYQFTPFTSISIEGQFGQLTGGDALHDEFAKQFINDYKSIILHTDVQMGEFIDYSRGPFLNGLKNLYFGTGFGVLMNKISAVQTVNAVDGTTLTYLPNSNNFLIPLRAGYEFKLFNRYDEPQWRFDVNYSLNTAFGAGLDGYTSVYTKSYIKFYNYISVGLKYSFGQVRSYHKDIGYSPF